MSSAIELDAALIGEREAIREQPVRRLIDEQPPVLGLGWLRDLPDFRDYTPEHEEVAPLLGKTAAIEAPRVEEMGGSVDLRPWFSPIENQGTLGSCTANAVVALVEYFERRAFGRHSDASRLFLYKTTRNLLRWTGDTGAFLRSTIGALTLFGVPPEAYWPYRIARFDEEPGAFCYSFAQNFQAISYYRLDTPGTSPQTVVGWIKSNLAAGLPSVFGFTVYSSIEQAAATGDIPFPSDGERVLGGHALVFVGYDDSREIENAAPGGETTTGAFLVRNSWGTGWGNAGYGALPYEYVRTRVAVDVWSLIKAEWVDTGIFS